MTQETERPLQRADTPSLRDALAATALHYLVLSRKIDEDYPLPKLELETIDRAEAQRFCQEMAAKDPTKKFKIETWTPMPRRRSDSD